MEAMERRSRRSLHSNDLDIAGGSFDDSADSREDFVAIVNELASGRSHQVGVGSSIVSEKTLT